MSLKIYTKTGDKGTTSLIGGTKVSKSDIRIDTYGTVDELNSWIGLLNDQLTQEHLKAELKEIQDRLFTIGSSLATDAEKEPKMKLPDLHDSDIEGRRRAVPHQRGCHHRCRKESHRAAIFLTTELRFSIFIRVFEY